MYNRFLPRLATASPLRVYTLLKSYWTIEKQWYNVLHAQWCFLLFICGWRHISKVLFFRFVLKFWPISGVVLGGKNFALIKLNFNNASPKSVGCAEAFSIIRRQLIIMQIFFTFEINALFIPALKIYLVTHTILLFLHIRRNYF